MSLDFLRNVHAPEFPEGLDWIGSEPLRLADLRGLDPKSRARLIIDKCAHPDYRPLLKEYLDMATRDCLARKAGHEPQLLDRVFKMQVNLAKNGTMKIDNWDL